MAVDTTHPLYNDFVSDWVQCRDAYRGERVVKDKGTDYLPKTSSMVARGHRGSEEYAAYKLRANFYDVMRDAVEASFGAMHQKNASIELPSALEPMLKLASLDGESLQQVIQRVNLGQLIAGRQGIMLDLPADDPNPAHPYFALYDAERGTNWNEGQFGFRKRLDFVALKESGNRLQDDFTWLYKEEYRVLRLKNGVYEFGVFKQDSKGGIDFDESAMQAASFAGRPLDEVPFIFVNSKDICAKPDDPPLIGLARLAFSMYRGEADYRQGLFMQSQDTLVIKGDADADEDKTYATGAGAAIILMDAAADAKFIGVNSQGLSEQRQALQADKERADRKSGRFIHVESTDRESGTALQTRLAAGASTLTQIALTGAAAMEQMLRKAAIWVGADPDEVVFAPNLDFTSNVMDGQELTALIAANQAGAPLSRRSIHRILQDRGLSEETYETELAQLKEDEAAHTARAKAEAEAVAPPEPVGPDLDQNSPKQPKTGQKEPKPDDKE